MTIEESYQDGYHFGSEQAERLLWDKMATGALEIEHREEARTAVSIAHTEAGRREAAWRLGVVRGFRQVVR